MKSCVVFAGVAGFFQLPGTSEPSWRPGDV